MKFIRTLVEAISLIILLTCAVLYGVSRQTRTAPLNQQPIFYYSPGSLQQKIVSDLIHRYNPQLSYQHHVQIVRAIFKEADASNFDPFLIAGLIAAESSFRPRAVSSCAAMGLMQLSHGVVKAMRIRDPYEINQNIYAGTRYLQYLKKRFGLDEMALAAYNAGPSQVTRLRRIPRIPETVSYIHKILILWRFQSVHWNLALQDLMQQVVLCPLLEIPSCQSLLAKSTSILQSRVISFVLLRSGDQIQQPDLNQIPFSQLIPDIIDRRLYLYPFKYNRRGRLFFNPYILS